MHGLWFGSDLSPSVHPLSYSDCILAAYYQQFLRHEVKRRKSNENWIKSCCERRQDDVMFYLFCYSLNFESFLTEE